MVVLGEILLEDLLVIMVEYILGGDKFYMGYSFELFINDYSVEYICNIVSILEECMIEGWLCWVFSNYDVECVVSCWSKDNMINL